MNNTIELDTLKGDDPIDTLTFDEASDSAVDLTEIIDYDKQEKVTKMVSGLENYISNGLLDLYTGSVLGLNTSKFEPGASHYNARFGGEGFISTAVEAVRVGIVAVIRFVKKIILWCFEKVKYIFGFGGSERQVAVMRAEYPKFKEEMVSYFAALGFPTDLMDVNKYMGSLEKFGHRKDHINIIKSKLIKDEDYLRQFNELYPLSQDIIKVFNSQIGKAKQAKAKLSSMIDETIRKSKSPHYDIKNNVELIRGQMMQVIQCFRYEDIVTSIQTLVEKSSGIKADNDKLTARVSDINRELMSVIQNAKYQMTPVFVEKIEQIMAFSGADGLQSMNDSANTFKDTLGYLYTLLDAEEVRKLEGICTFTKDQTLMMVYQNMTVIVNNFTNYAKIALEILKRTTDAFNSMTAWYSDTVKFFIKAAADDVNAIIECFNKAKQRHDKENQIRISRGQTPEPFPVEMAANGLPKNLVMMSDLDARTAMEKMSVINSELVNANVIGIKDSLNNFGRASGWGKLA